MPKQTERQLRPSLTPGTVCIILAGRFRGRRVVFLQKMKRSSTLLVTGPYKVNGVPLRRIDPAYVIATSTKIDISKVALPKVDDDFFRSGDKGPISESRLTTQKDVDSKLLKAIDSEHRAYLGSIFTLSNKDKPHEMKF